MRRTRLALLLALPLALGVACSGPTAPDTQVSLSIETQESCRMIHHVILSGRVLNTGGNPVWYAEGCGPATGIQVRLFDPNGDEVVYRDPRAVPLCSDQTVTLTPGQDVGRQVEFTGAAYVAVPGGYELVRAPEGLYTVRIEFRFAGSPVSGPKTATRSATFQWSNAVTCGS